MTFAVRTITRALPAVVLAFGRDRREASLAVAHVVLVSGDQRVAADFVEDVLMRCTITLK
jgi:uncharacterized membrane protein YccC